ncbi:Protrudin [Acropora cervicornis]|uniref:Protrudin n=1 Tax=Acropora cervicornis TaxID=6130 RepID=A0AAD9QCQ7_ACRCE|nr:Protrudin [Acropora cervicornis]
MHEDNLLTSEDELDSRSQGPSDFNPEQENGVVKFDIVYLLFVPLVYCIFVLLLAAVRNIGLNHSKGNLELLRNKFKRKEDVGNMELKRAAIKQAQEDLHAYINISIEIQEFEENLCEYIERFYRICRWEETSLSKVSLLVLLFVAFTLVLLPGKYLITIGILGIFLGNPDFKEGTYFIPIEALVKAYDAETLSESEGDDDIVEVDDIEDDEYEDVPSVERQKKVVCGLTKVSHFSNSRKKKKQINRGNCAACDVSFSSVLKKRQYCRHCGVSFCSRCCCKRVKRAVFGATAPAAYEETVLVCKSCYGYLMNKVDDMKTDIW